VLVAACAGGRASARPAVVPAGVATPALARVVAFADTIHGVPVSDPLRWMEDTLAADTRTWVAAEARYTTDVLTRLVGRDSLTALYERAWRDAPTLGRVIETPTGLLLSR